jgi:excinuclease ABC subunit B
MRRAIAETDRRRQKQITYNEAHGITPRGVSKRIKDMIEGVYDTSPRHDLEAAEKLAAYGTMNEKDLLKELKRIEREMLESARNLEFEQAARLRDQLKELKQLAFGVVEPDEPVAAGPARAPVQVSSIAAGRRRKA